MSSFDIAFKTVSDLVKDFKDNEKYYLSNDYQEADVRNDFTNKFFIALGWDVRHETQKNPYEQEVRVEKPLQIAKAQKRADYAFSLTPHYRIVKFFVEAKKPSHGLENKDYYFQTARYGWNANTPIAVLTDFEEFHIIDCRFRPNINDALNYKIEQFRYTDYTDKEKFAKIYYLFSREEVAKNSIEKYEAELPKPRGKKAKSLKTVLQSIDESFLEELDEIRNDLAKSFKKNNTHLSSEELTEATQRTIDRLVFIKFLEDKLIEPDHYVSEFGGRKKAWEDFITASRTLDAKYNGVVFKKSLIDTRNVIEPDDKTFSAICEELSHENTPYNFDAIPIHILGSIYERFLGKVVNATDKRVTIEEKPEVRKAGGVYYTPQYIVNYIVDNTVGKQIEGKTPKEIAKLRFADIACGSGSFLITVFERLLDYHKRWYIENPEQAKKDGCILVEGTYRLSLKQKTKILLNNVYGVDIDQQAVEVTQLSLYLKLLEDETTATANDSWVMFKEQLLPDLNKNIVCGNSLIGTDILNPTSFLPFSKGEDEKISLPFVKGGTEGGLDELKLKPMDFETVFPHIFSSQKDGGPVRRSLQDAGGFDAIVGNPPYVLGRETFEDKIKDYLKRAYTSYGGKFDLYIYFTERGIKLIKENGYLSYIIPNTILVNENATELRKLILKDTFIEKIKTFNQRVFKKAQVESVILVLEKNKSASSDKKHLIDIDSKISLQIKQLDFSNTPRNRFIIDSYPEERILLDKLRSKSILLKAISDICIGIQLGGSSGRKIKSDFLSNSKIDHTYKKVLDGKEINSYYLLWNGNYVKYGKWLHRKRDEKYFVNPKILVRQIGAVPIATFDDGEYYTLNTLYNILITEKKYSPKYILAFINSKIGKWCWRKENTDYKTLFPKIKKEQLQNIFISEIDFTERESISKYDKLIESVDQMLTAKKQLQQAKTESDKTYLERKCATLDKQIDELVYQLYGLTEEEIKIVEGKF